MSTATVTMLFALHAKTCVEEALVNHTSGALDKTAWYPRHVELERTMLGKSCRSGGCSRCSGAPSGIPIRRLTAENLEGARTLRPLPNTTIANESCPACESYSLWVEARAARAKAARAEARAEARAKANGTEKRRRKGSKQAEAAAAIAKQSTRTRLPRYRKWKPHVQFCPFNRVPRVPSMLNNSFEIVICRSKEARMLFQRTVNEFLCPFDTRRHKQSSNKKDHKRRFRIGKRWRWMRDNMGGSAALASRHVFTALVMNGPTPCAAALFSDAHMTSHDTTLVSRLITNRGNNCRGAGAAILCHLIQNSRNGRQEFSALKLLLMIEDPKLRDYFASFGCKRNEQFRKQNNKNPARLYCDDPKPKKCEHRASEVFDANEYWGHIPIVTTSAPEIKLPEPKEEVEWTKTSRFREMRRVIKDFIKKENSDKYGFKALGKKKHAGYVVDGVKHVDNTDISSSLMAWKPEVFKQGIKNWIRGKYYR
eukprot:gnl/TRDRNA2_/TRDRNA2_188322_c0_seq1.p1 gnl/TRDRNA2_/TRDRNA2_188322_c0~~gnl/TRDRNA2_/TRDRNA2_188322_c0_seq1.p1  ORF type:complete len:481 (+),score=43.59 gnl/TRDRNA2_/TRDRNA2_188322_c0_seq1:120-1562(+)